MGNNVMFVRLACYFYIHYTHKYFFCLLKGGFIDTIGLIWTAGNFNANLLEVLLINNNYFAISDTFAIKLQNYVSTTKPASTLQ